MYLCDVYQNNRVYSIPASPFDKAHRSSWIVLFHCNYMPLKKINTSNTRNGNLYITRNDRHFAPAVQLPCGVIKLQLIMRGSIDYRMSTRRSERSHGKRIDYRSLNNLCSVDFNAISKRNKKRISRTKQYTVERLISRRETREVSFEHNI